MLGAAGALCCMAGGTALGIWLRDRKQVRLHMLQAQMDAVAAIRMLLEQERPALTELLRAGAEYISAGYGAERVTERLRETANRLEQNPSLGLADAYEQACGQIGISCEQEEERTIMRQLFHQLDGGTAGMREQAAAACLRRLKPLAETARTQAESGGKLCMQLGTLAGLMAGIVLW